MCFYRIMFIYMTPFSLLNMIKCTYVLLYNLFYFPFRIPLSFFWFTFADPTRKKVYASNTQKFPIYLLSEINSFMGNSIINNRVVRQLQDSNATCPNCKKVSKTNRKR